MTRTQDCRGGVAGRPSRSPVPGGSSGWWWAERTAEGGTVPQQMGSQAGTIPLAKLPGAPWKEQAWIAALKARIWPEVEPLRPWRLGLAAATPKQICLWAPTHLPFLPQWGTYGTL